MRTGTGECDGAPAGRNSGRFPSDDRGFLLQRILPLSVKGLEGMFDPERQRFCFRAVRNGQGVRNEGTSRRYSMISLLGLARMEKGGRKSPIDMESALSSLLPDAETIDGIGDLGLLLWLCALASPDRAPEAWRERRMAKALFQCPDALEGRTMELSWFLAGIAHAALAKAQGIPGLEEQASRTFERLMRNYGRKGIFGHSGTSTLAGFVRGRIGSFADQAYPIYALARYSQAFGSRTALAAAVECAEAICRLQGPLGQWWWHYDAAASRVIGRYPVYSVHQDGMAPMALLAVGEASGRSFHTELFKGLEWIAGRNERGLDLVDPSRNVIWRSLYREKYRAYAHELSCLLRLSGPEKEFDDLAVRYECRPYHMGWLLYALSNMTSLPGFGTK